MTRPTAHPSGATSAALVAIRAHYGGISPGRCLARATASQAASATAPVTAPAPAVRAPRWPAKAAPAMPPMTPAVMTGRPRSVCAPRSFAATVETYPPRPLRRHTASQHDRPPAVHALTIGEIRLGIERLRRKDSTQADLLEQWLRGLHATYGDHIIRVDNDIADEWGRLNAGYPSAQIDQLWPRRCGVQGVRLRLVRWSGQGRIVRAVMRPSAANWKWNLRLTGLPGKSPAMSTAASWPVVVALTSRRV